MSVVVAAFDVDHTLTVRDCVVPFMVRTAGRIGFAKACLTQPIDLVRCVLRRDRDSIKAHFVAQIFKGRRVEDVEQDGVLFASEVVGSWMRADVVRRMRWHQSQGHVVVLVSASLDAYLQFFGDLCEVDAVLCTQLEIEDGVYTGKIVGKNCRGQEKVARLQQWFEESGLSAESLTYAYGDSSGDTAMLESADFGFLVKNMDDVEEFV